MSLHWSTSNSLGQDKHLLSTERWESYCKILGVYMGTLDPICWKVLHFKKSNTAIFQLHQLQSNPQVHFLSHFMYSSFLRTESQSCFSASLDRMWARPFRLSLCSCSTHKLQTLASSPSIGRANVTGRKYLAAALSRVTQQICPAVV